MVVSMEAFWVHQLLILHRYGSVQLCLMSYPIDFLIYSLEAKNGYFFFLKKKRAVQ